MAAKDKGGHVQAQQDWATDLADLVERARLLNKDWFTNLYAAGNVGTEILQTDCDPYNVVVGDLPAGITLIQQVIALNDNTALSQADYASTVAKLRKTN